MTQDGADYYRLMTSYFREEPEHALYKTREEADKGFVDAVEEVKARYQRDHRVGVVSLYLVPATPGERPRLLSQWTIPARD